MCNAAHLRFGVQGWETDLEMMIKKICEEILVYQRARFPGVPESVLSEGAQALTEVVVRGVRAALMDLPVRSVKPAEQYQPPAGLSPERTALLLQIHADGVKEQEESSKRICALRRRNQEERARKFFDDTSVSPITVEAFIEAAKREAGW